MVDVRCNRDWTLGITGRGYTIMNKLEYQPNNPLFDWLSPNYNFVFNPWGFAYDVAWPLTPRNFHPVPSIPELALIGIVP
jgi:hypothetical protein